MTTRTATTATARSAVPSARPLSGGNSTSFSRRIENKQDICVQICEMRAGMRRRSQHLVARILMLLVSINGVCSMEHHHSDGRFSYLFALRFFYSFRGCLSSERLLVAFPSFCVVFILPVYGPSLAVFLSLCSTLLYPPSVQLFSQPQLVDTLVFFNAVTR